MVRRVSPSTIAAWGGEAQAGLWAEGGSGFSLYELGGMMGLIGIPRFGETARMGERFILARLSNGGMGWMGGWRVFSMERSGMLG